MLVLRNLTEAYDLEPSSQHDSFSYATNHFPC